MRDVRFECGKFRPSFNLGKLRRWCSKVRCPHLRVKNGRRLVAIADAPKSIQLIVFQNFASLQEN
jgi:hypothetical protein